MVIAYKNRYAAWFEPTTSWLCETCSTSWANALGLDFGWAWIEQAHVWFEFQRTRLAPSLEEGKFSKEKFERLINVKKSTSSDSEESFDGEVAKKEKNLESLHPTFEKKIFQKCWQEHNRGQKFILGGRLWWFLGGNKAPFLLAFEPKTARSQTERD